jgi:hypothetical protein
MALVTSQRDVNLIDNRFPEKPYIPAVVYRGFFANQLGVILAKWATAREEAAWRGKTAGLAPLEHSHWDWRNKADCVEAGTHMLVAVECEQEIQGLVAVLRLPRAARLGGGHVVYVDYVESAPWNLKGAVDPPRFLGVGTVLMAEVIRISSEEGFDGRVGLHSLPQSEVFYEKCKMTRVGEDPAYYDLAYYEYPGRQGIDWLSAVGESL